MLFTGFHDTVTAVPDLNMYCGARECYFILDVPQDATKSDIRKAYRSLSLRFHPDKNPSADAAASFREIATAYEILSSTKSRDAYDYYLAHPEESAYNSAMYYTVVYAPQTDARLVIGLFLVILSLVQHASQHTKHAWALKHFRASDTITRKAALLCESRHPKGAFRRDKKGKKVALEAIVDELMDGVEISGGYAKPDVWTLLLPRMLMFPVTALRYGTWYLHWVIQHDLRKLPYSEDEKIYLTIHTLGIQTAYFESDMFVTSRHLLVALTLWEDDHLACFFAESAPVTWKQASYSSHDVKALLAARRAIQEQTERSKLHESDSEDDPDFIEE